MKTLTITLLLILSSCGPCPDVQTYQAISPQPQINNGYGQCLSHNPNLCYSPAWYYWVTECKRRWQVTTNLNPTCNYLQPYPNDR